MAKWKLSKNYLEKLVNKTIFLVWFGRKYDKYERRLGYIFYEKTNVNKELVRLGYAHVYSLEKNDLTDELIKVENQARNNKIGIWKKSNISNCINMRIDDEQEFALIKNKCKFNITTCNWTLKDEATHIFHFPCTTLTNTNNITVYSKNENNTDFSFGYKYVWNNDGDKAFLRDKNGLLASYAVV